MALTDYDYLCDDKKRTPRTRSKTEDFIILPQRLEEELAIFDKCVNTIRNFDFKDPCKTNNKGQPKSIDSNRAYDIVYKAMSADKIKVKQSKLGEVFDNAITKAGFKPDEIW